MLDGPGRSTPRARVRAAPGSRPWPMRRLRAGAPSFLDPGSTHARGVAPDIAPIITSPPRRRSQSSWPRCSTRRTALPAPAHHRHRPPRCTPGPREDRRPSATATCASGPADTVARGSPPSPAVRTRTLSFRTTPRSGERPAFPPGRGPTDHRRITRSRVGGRFSGSRSPREAAVQHTMRPEAVRRSPDRSAAANLRDTASTHRGARRHAAPTPDDLTTPTRPAAPSGR